MSRPELKTLEKKLLDDTVLSQFLEPLMPIFDELRHHHRQFHTLTMSLFCMLGCLRHLSGTTILREQIQDLFHIAETKRVPLARSTWSDALKSNFRTDALDLCLEKLYQSAKGCLPDKLENIPGLNNRPIYAVDGTYQPESCHFNKQTPKQGGNDNPKGHCLLPYFDVRLGIPVATSIDTSSAHETVALKEYALELNSLFRVKNAIWLADRGFVDAPFWDSLHKARGIDVITRLKENLVILKRTDRPIASSIINEGIISDETIQLKSSAKNWRLVTFQTIEGEVYTYMTNNFDLEPGVIAFLYLRRWDEEKCFDTWKNDYAQGKAWGREATAIKNQALLAIMTSILVAIFENDRLASWGISDKKALEKQEKRFDNIEKKQKLKGNKPVTKPWYFYCYVETSKVSRQLLRFLKSCFLKKPSKQLYDCELTAR